MRDIFKWCVMLQYARVLDILAYVSYEYKHNTRRLQILATLQIRVLIVSNQVFMCVSVWNGQHIELQTLLQVEGEKGGAER